MPDRRAATINTTHRPLARQSRTDNHANAATPDSHPDCRCLPTQIAALQAKAEFPVHRLCRVLGVSQSGYFAWKSRPACRRQRDDVVLLAHVRSAFALSNSTYGSPRMTRELRDSGLTVGRRRIARLMRENGLRLDKSGGSSGPRTPTN